MDSLVPGVLRQSADLVRHWGDAKLPDGKTLAEKMTLQGIPLWEIIAVDLALYLVPKALSLNETRTQPSSFQKLKPFLSKAKHDAQYYLINRRKIQDNPVWPSKKTALFLGYNWYFYREILQPVVSRLSMHQDIHTKSLYDDRAKLITQSPVNQGLQSIWQYWNEDVRAHTDILRKSLKNTRKDLLEAQMLPLIIENQDQYLWPQMAHTFRWLFWSYLPFLLSQVAIAYHILKKYHPALVVTPDTADPRTRIYCILAGQMNIPSLEVQVGACGPEDVERQFCVTDYIAVSGMQARQQFIGHGVAPEKIVVTGSPRHDSLASVSEEARLKFRQKFGIPQKNILVLFASTYNQASYNDIAKPEVVDESKRAVFKAASQVKGLTLAVKPHPLEDVEETKQMAGMSPNILFMDQNEDIREMIKACDVFVSLGTAATVDALFVNKLVICPIFPGWAWGDLFVKDGATLVPHSVEEIIDIFRQLVDGSLGRMLEGLQPYRQKFVEQWVYRVDGQSAARIEALSLDMMKG